MIEKLGKYAVTQLGIIHTLSLITGIASFLVLCIWIQNRKRFYESIRKILVNMWVPYVQLMDMNRDGNHSNIPKIPGTLNPIEYSTAALKAMGLSDSAASGSEVLSLEEDDGQSKDGDDLAADNNPSIIQRAKLEAEVKKKESEIQRKIAGSGGFWIVWSGPPQRRTVITKEAPVSKTETNQDRIENLSDSVLIKNSSNSSDSSQLIPKDLSSTQSAEPEEPLKDKEMTYTYRIIAKNYFLPPRILFSENLSPALFASSFNAQNLIQENLLISKTLQAFLSAKAGVANDQLDIAQVVAFKKFTTDAKSLRVVNLTPIHQIKVALTHNHRHTRSQNLPSAMPLSDSFASEFTLPSVNNSTLVNSFKNKVEFDAEETPSNLEKIRKLFVDHVIRSPKGSIQFVGLVASPFAYFAKYPTLGSADSTLSNDDTSDYKDALVRALRVGGAVQVRKSVSREEIISSPLASWQIAVILPPSTNDQSTESSEAESISKELGNVETKSSSASRSDELKIHLPSLQLAWLGGKVEGNLEQHFVLIPTQIAVDLNNREVIGALLHVLCVDLERL